MPPLSSVTPGGRRTRPAIGETHTRCQDAAGAGAARPGGRARRPARAPAAARDPVQVVGVALASAISLTERGVDQTAAAARRPVDRRGDEGADDRVRARPAARDRR